MTPAKVQPLCKVHNINLGYFDAKEVNSRSVTDTNEALYLYNKLIFLKLEITWYRFQ